MKTNFKMLEATNKQEAIISINDVMSENPLFLNKCTSDLLRLYGTLDQINKAGDKYMQRTGQKLDEAYNYCLNSKESVWYNKSENEIISANLQTYAKQYNKNEALIINII